MTVMTTEVEIPAYRFKERVHRVELRVGFRRAAGGLEVTKVTVERAAECGATVADRRWLAGRELAALRASVLRCAKTHARLRRMIAQACEDHAAGPNRELTFVGRTDDYKTFEVYAVVRGGVPVDVYTDVRRVLGDPEEDSRLLLLRRVTRWRPGKNPLFAHAADPKAAYAHCRDHYNLGGDDQ
jgi:hypothetical protein